ncbi:hypothetical protein CDAR_594281 [Caerostris darwini]|uniref:Uncharacterized protein n=1 Tax=Caerostris darwini TaxID=1538125 RepID=A0AAV4PC03_9ARAC|nr:hypothetical protein CDAR_594281 [Caerostris darwini]
MGAVVEVSKYLVGEGLGDMIAEDIKELLVEEETDEASLVEMISGIHDNPSEDDSTGEHEEVKRFTLQSTKKGLCFVEQLKLYFLYEDPSNERSSNFKRDLHKRLAPCQEIYKVLFI